VSAQSGEHDTMPTFEVEILSTSTISRELYIVKT
jgi:hypothetical protein